MCERPFGVKRRYAMELPFGEGGSRPHLFLTPSLFLASPPSLRKHHCRNCGYIFCAECSDNKMPLPSSAKPVRVCDSCQTELLANMAAGQ